MKTLIVSLVCAVMVKANPMGKWTDINLWSPKKPKTAVLF